MPETAGGGGELEPTEENLAAFAERNSYTDLGEEELLSYYEDTSYGAVYDYVNDYISGLEITKTESYEAIDVASFYPALLELRSALTCRKRTHLLQKVPQRRAEFAS